MSVVLKNYSNETQILSIEGGGTGGSTVAEARSNLNLGPASSWTGIDATLAANTDTVVMSLTNLPPNSLYIISASVMANFNSTSNRVLMNMSGGTNGSTINNMWDTMITTWHHYTLSGLVDTGDNGAMVLTMSSQTAGKFTGGVRILRIG